jgi:hypothetical protein
LFFPLGDHDALPTPTLAADKQVLATVDAKIKPEFLG